MKDNFRKYISLLVEHYWILPFVLVVLGVITSLLILVAIPCRWLMLMAEYTSDFFFILGILCVLLMLPLIVAVFAKDSAHGLGSMLMCGGAVVVWLMMIGIAGLMNPDPYAYLHPIPKGLDYEVPMDGMDGQFPDVVETDSSTWLQISTHYIGQFEYTFYYPSLPDGEIFLRCFEAGTNAPLSAESIEQKTLTTIAPDSTFCCRVSRCDFLIYEGDAQQYYVARIEVWFRAAETGEERCLLHKYYRVDGYER